MGLETERVKKLVRSACRFSASELYESINQLKQRAEEKQNQEYRQRKKVFAKMLKVGDQVQLVRNGYSIPYGAIGTVTHVSLIASKNIAAVWADFDGKKRGFYIRDLCVPGISQSQIDLNRSLAGIRL